MASNWDERTDVESPRTAELTQLVDRAQLVMLVGDRAGRVYAVGNTPIVIGRGSQATVRVSATEVSRAHARISREAFAQFSIEDLESRNGTRVNGIPVTRQKLRFGDKIQIGSGAVFVFTHYDQMDEQLLQLQKLDSIGQLASGVAHDFGNLLHAIVGNLDFLHRRARTHYAHDAEMLQALEDTKQAAKRGTDLTGRLLAVTRQQQGEMENIALASIVKEVVGLLERALPKTIDIEAHVDDDLAVLGNRGSLHQVLMNICLNARDAMMDGGRLSITACATTVDAQAMLTSPFLPAGSYAVLSVSDTGQGMDDETRRRVFEPFFSTKGAHGTGLGLASAYGIIRNHGGRLLVRSEIEKGSTFDIHLPAQEAFASPNTMRLSKTFVSSDSGSLPAATEQHPDDTIMLVDDDEMIRASTSRLVTELGYPIICANDGEEAVERYKKDGKSIRLVLLDLVMPKLGGAQTLSVLRELDPEVNVLLISGAANEEEANSLLRVGARGFLRKPFNAHGLHRAIADVLAPR